MADPVQLSDQGALIKSTYEAVADTNAFTDAEKTKLAAVEASATADQTGAEIKTAYEAEAGATKIVAAPATEAAAGAAGQYALDANFRYDYSAAAGRWFRTPLVEDTWS